MISLSLEEYKNDPNVLKQEYMSMPDLRIVTLPFKKDVVKNAENGLRFDMKSLFNLTDTKEFVNLNAVKSFLDVYFGKTMTSSKSIVDIVNSYDTRKNKVQLWFLPTGETDDLSMELKKQIENHVFGHRYYVHIQNGKQGLKEDYENHINNLIKTEKNKEIIILLGRQLSTAVSIKKADIVVLLNHNSSNDLLKQMTFRCMTDDGPEKKYGIVVDFDQQRVVRSVISLVRYIPGESTSSRIKRAINCCSIDDTVIDPRDSTAVYESLYTLWRNDPRYEFEDIIDRLSKLQHKELTKEDYKYLETKLNGVSTKTKTTIRETKEILDDDEKLNYDDEGDAKSIVSDTSSVNEEVKQVIDYLKELQSTIPNFMALLTYNSRECDLKTLLLEMKNNKELEDLFIQQSRCMWGYSVPKDFFMKCVYFLEKYYTEYERSEINSAIERIKEMLQECISLDKKKELLKLLMDSLTPKETEKKQFGEVFTPLELIEEMLDKLPSHVWSDPNLKWLDPAAGIGNFPVCIYYRLMDGLSKTFPNEQERKSHILKNMLFMSELNTKNVFVLKLLFNEENIYCGDSLKLDANQVWGVDVFDIIVGNPPYQETDASGDNKLYLKFTEFSIKNLVEDGILMFITPRNIVDYLLMKGKNRNYISNLYKIKYLSVETIKRYFKTVGSTFIWFILEKTECNNFISDIEFNDNSKIMNTKVNLNDFIMLPKTFTDINLSLINKTTSKDDVFSFKEFSFKGHSQRIRNQHLQKGIVSKNKTEKHKYPIIDTINKKNTFPGIYYYYDKCDDDFNSKKIVFSKKGYLEPTIDDGGEYTYSDNFKYILGSSELIGIQILFKSKLFKYLLKEFSINGFDNIKIASIVRKIDVSKIVTEKQLYELYGLTADEINLVETVS